MELHGQLGEGCSDLSGHYPFPDNGEKRLRYGVGVFHKCALGQTYGIAERFYKDDESYELSYVWLVVDIPTIKEANQLCEFLNSCWAWGWVAGAGANEKSQVTIPVDLFIQNPTHDVARIRP